MTPQLAWKHGGASKSAHIFQLGRKYSQAMESRFTNEAGREEPFWMGCYGIGVPRLAQAAVEQHHDEAGISWPESIAPFDAVVVIANINDDVQTDLGESLYQSLRSAGVDALGRPQGTRWGQVSGCRSHRNPLADRGRSRCL